MKYLLGLILLSCSFQVFAWDGIVDGKIHIISVAPGENYGFRVILDNTPALCGNSHNWAYLNESASNYDAFVSVLLAAKMGDKNVKVYSNQQPGTGYCEIGYVGMW